MDNVLLQVNNFSVSFDTYAGEVKAVRSVNLDVVEGETLAIVGESGSGKSVMTQSFVRLLPAPPARIASGEVFFGGEDILTYSFSKLRSVKGAQIAYIFQDPMTSLNPTKKIGAQLIEGMLAHHAMNRQSARAEALALLTRCGINNAERRLEQYPYELSGGMRQRVMIALAIALKPKLLIADEPTTALDVTIQAQILQILKDLNRERGMSMILITHDMGIVAGIATRVLVMYGGKIVERGLTSDIFERAAHPYTRSLLAAVPRLDIDSGQSLEYIVGSPPDMLNPPPGCPFAPRCQYSMKACFAAEPPEIDLGGGRRVSCFLHHPGAVARLKEFDRDFAREEAQP